MTSQTRTSLKELQQLDQEIAAVRSAMESFEPLLEEIDAPVLRLEQDVQGLEKRLTEIRLEEKRIELTIEERTVRATKLQGRMEAVRNVREEAAVHAELEMVKRALESEEQEALSLLDQIRRLEERREEQQEAYQEALAEVGPRREELVQEQESAEGKLEALQAEREAFADGIDPGERRIYDSIMAGARDVAVSELTQDGACGNCYNMVPLQIQNRIRHTEEMIRCEGCGVILTPESAEGLALAQEEGERIERALKASTEQRDAERVAVSEAEALENVEEDTVAEAAAVELISEEAVIESVDQGQAPTREPIFADILADEALDDAPTPEAAVEAPVRELVFADIVSEEDPVEAPVEAPDDSIVETAVSDETASEDSEVGNAGSTEASSEAQGVEDEVGVEDKVGEEDVAEGDVDVEAAGSGGEEPAAEEAERQEPTADG